MPGGGDVYIPMTSADHKLSAGCRGINDNQPHMARTRGRFLSKNINRSWLPKTMRTRREATNWLVLNGTPSSQQHRYEPGRLFMKLYTAYNIIVNSFCWMKLLQNEQQHILICITSDYSWKLFMPYFRAMRDKCWCEE